MRPSSLALAVFLASFSSAGCSSCGGGSSSPAPAASASAAPALLDSAFAAPPDKPHAPAPSREGNVVARAAEDDALFVADEDASVIHIVPLPFDLDKPTLAVALPGRPAQVLALADRVLVTIRDPGLLLVMRRDPKAGLVELSRVSLTADAWGIAITKDEKTALVSSAWTHTISAVDLATSKVRFVIDVSREPRGIVIMPDASRAYVSHLVGAALTRIDGLGSDKPTTKRVDLPAGRLRVIYEGKHEKDASLGYALALSPDGKRLFAARHALGASAKQGWAGAPSVDVLLTRDDSPLVPPRNKPPFQGTDAMSGFSATEDPNYNALPLGIVQPRAIVYRRASGSLLVLGEGTGRMAELDAHAIDPTASPKRIPQVLSVDPDHKSLGCGAPSGLALSSDERAAYVFCRTTSTLARVSFDPQPEPKKPDWTGVTLARLGEMPKDAGLAEGRRLFHDASDAEMSGGFACAGCHPEGRDDGFVWTEDNDEEVSNRLFFHEETPERFARQTPMLAGRASAKGPYGWHAESEELADRVLGGFRLHRWQVIPPGEEKKARPKALVIAEFVRRGLVPPPRLARDLSEAEKKGKTIFESPSVGCRTCHVGEEYTDRAAIEIARMPSRAGFGDEPDKKFKTPSLLYVGGTAPYYHDGSAATLEDLVSNNDDRMGKTNQLSAEDKAALVAFLRTL